MLTYTFSRREKMLILVLAIILVALAWFILVFQRTNDEIHRIDGEIATAQSEMTLANAKLGKMTYMQSVIDESKAAGITPRPVPNFDNMTLLMGELNRVMAPTNTYTISFDKLDRETSAEYVLRGVRIDYSCESVEQAEAIAVALEQGAFPCHIDSVAISNNASGGSSRVVGSVGGGAVSASVHVVFIERA